MSPDESYANISFYAKKLRHEEAMFAGYLKFCLICTIFVRNFRNVNCFCSTECQPKSHAMYSNITLMCLLDQHVDCQWERNHSPYFDSNKMIYIHNDGQNTTDCSVIMWISSKDQYACYDCSGVDAANKIQCSKHFKSIAIRPPDTSNPTVPEGSTEKRRTDKTDSGIQEPNKSQQSSSVSSSIVIMVLAHLLRIISNDEIAKTIEIN